MFAVHELGFLATRVDVAICANIMDVCVRREPTTCTFQNRINSGDLLSTKAKQKKMCVLLRKIRVDR